MAGLCNTAPPSELPGCVAALTTMKLLFVADPIESFKTHKDTTFAMMREAARRGHTLQVC